MFPSEKSPPRGPWPVAPISTCLSPKRHTLNQLEEAGRVRFSCGSILISWGGVTYKIIKFIKFIKFLKFIKFIKFISHEDPPKAKSKT